MKQFQATPKGLTLMEIMAYFSSEEKARTHLESIYWPQGPVCPRCKTNDKTRISKPKGESVRPGLHCCKDCRKQFTVTIGTIFEDSHIPLNKWLVAFYLMCSSKKGISSLQLQRMLDLGSYKTALFMSHRIRFAMKDHAFDAPLNGIVECDEVFIGGRKPVKGDPMKDTRKRETSIVSMVERGGNKRSFIVKHVTAQNIRALVKTHVDPKAELHTDQAGAYALMGRTMKHRSVNHSKKEYARRDADGVLASTNTVESSFSLLRRGLMGTFHHVSTNHLHRYVAEFDYRWNTRKESDKERTSGALAKCKGKRLLYETQRYRTKKQD